MLNKRSKQLRRETIKLSKANGGYHFGGSFSCIEILIALFDNILKEEDEFILSKGHACWGYYVLLREKGLNPKLEGHPSRDPYNGVTCTTGSMGHGFPTAVGIALAKKIKNETGNVYVLMGDGECQEGTTWESLLIAAEYKLDNLVVLVDFNKIQGSGFTNEILSLDHLVQITALMGWNSTCVLDGHNIEELETRIKSRAFHSFEKNKPSFFQVCTVKGKGVSFMENKPKWHACWLDDEKEKLALEELIAT
jgi:transketolase